MGGINLQNLTIVTNMIYFWSQSGLWCPFLDWWPLDRRIVIEATREYFGTGEKLGGGGLMGLESAPPWS